MFLSSFGCRSVWPEGLVFFGEVGSHFYALDAINGQ
jgi:hypothetical protein